MAPTRYCDAVDDEVTILVYKDWSTRCTGYQKRLSTARRLRISLIPAKRGQKIGIAVGSDESKARKQK